MLRKKTIILLLATIVIYRFTLAQAQPPRLPFPTNFYVFDDVLYWGAVEGARGYRIGLFSRNTCEAACRTSEWVSYEQQEF
ncbi:MAG: hypothetical protein OXH44_09470, partial [Chloroflexi bacterium]|nr:hypothetical protein [Chloroflexota bacterium]